MKIKCPPLILAVFIFSLSYWFLLSNTSVMSLGGDAGGYEQLGQRVRQEGWVGYFKKGPEREPLYIALIARSMAIADQIHIDYKIIQKTFQIAILCLTQILLWQILCRLNIPIKIAFGVLTYFAISPGIVNSGLSLYSEIATYPLILWIILLSANAWETLNVPSPRKSILTGLLLGLTFACLTLAKAIFDLIFPIYILLFVALGINHLMRNQKQCAKNALWLCLMTFLIFEGIIIGYKTTNKFYNDNFAISDRGAWALYGNITRRSEPLTFRRTLAALAYVPGQGFCESLLSPNECLAWSFVPSDGYGRGKNQELFNTGLPWDKINKTMIDLAKQQIIQNPIQHIFLMFVEGNKMLFWESTRIGFVSYAPWLEKIYTSSIAKNGLRFAIFLITLLALIITIRSLPHNPKSENRTIILMLWLCLIYTGAYSLFFNIARYALPLAPIYLIFIAFAGNKICARITIKNHIS